MTARTLALCSALTAIMSTAAFAQSEQRPRPGRGSAPPSAPAAKPAQPPEPKPAAAPPPPPRREGQPVNIKTEITIVDQRGGATATRKTVSVIVADGLTGFIRSTSNYTTMPGRIENVPLNVDVEPLIVADGKIRLRLNVQYDLPNALASPQEGAEMKAGNLFSTQLRENLSLILESGKPLVAAQSADPVGDRQVTIEVKATVMR